MIPLAFAEVSPLMLYCMGPDWWNILRLAGSF
jgi:hypothetical protein